MAGGEQVYATLLLSDSYLPGALVLAHSLRDARSTKKLAVLVTLDSVSAEAITQLKAVYDYVLPVPRIRNSQPANLELMNRGDLHSAFTKINLWKQVQFSKIVYIDADVVAYRAPDELFDITYAFAAAPDIGWPDLFNSGVMVLTPNMADYYAMMAMADKGISFDGADQGLLNMYFANDYHRLSFTYNVTPSAHYQYVPAYRHLRSSINMVHFIGANKPWFTGRNTSQGSSPFDEMVGRWWAVYDRHYKVKKTQESTPAPHAPPEVTPEVTPERAQPSPTFVQYFTKGEWQPQTAAPGFDTHDSRHQPQTFDSGHHHHQHHHSAHGGNIQTVDFAPQPAADVPAGAGPEIRPQSSSGGHESGHPHTHQHQSSHAHQPHATHQPPAAQVHTAAQTTPPTQAPPPEHKPEPIPVQMASWDPQRQPPPIDSKPEAMNFPSTHYAMSRDSTPFVPPKRYPSPPRNMWYEVPKEPPAPSGGQPKPMFPWESRQARPSRKFPGAAPEPPLPLGGSPTQSQGEPQSLGEPHAPPQPSPTVSTLEGSVAEPSTPSTSRIKIQPPVEPWTSYQLVNAWDEVPQINRYVEGFKRHRRGKSADIASPLGVVTPVPGRRSRGFKLTDFPSAAERPSLPVTPLPISRPSFWGGDKVESHGSEAQETLPAAEGVPAQSEWDPRVQLEKLARQHSEQLLRRLSGGDQGGAGEGEDTVIPKRSLPFGSENAKSPTYAAQAAVSEVARPKPVKGRRPTMGTALGGQSSAAPTGASTATRGDSRGEPQGAGSATKEGSSSSQLLESPMPRLDSDKAKGACQ